MRPSLGGRNPLMMENSVVLPAPLGPISAVIRPASTASEALSTARRPPKRLNTRSTRSSGSAMGALQDRRPQTRKTPTQIGQQGRDGGGNCHSDELDPHCVDADRFGSVLIFTHSDKPGAEPALLDQAHDDERNGKERKHDPIERRAALELERLRPQIERNQDADA